MDFITEPKRSTIQETGNTGYYLETLKESLLLY